MTTPRRILVLYRHDPRAGMSRAVHSHLHVLDGRGHDVHYANAIETLPESLRLLGWDAIVLHTTFLTWRWSLAFRSWKLPLGWLAELDSLKIALPQDEYDHAEVLDEWLHELGVEVVFTNFDSDHRPRLYPLLHDRAAFERCLTGYVDERELATAGVTPLRERPLDVVYRARHLPYSFGSHGQLKHTIAAAAEGAAERLGLRADISTALEDTITGPAWLDFLGSGRATVGTESGSSVLDRRGEIHSAVERLLRAAPELTFAEVAAHMPAGWDDHAFFALGPRHFEAVATRTPQVLVEGRYDDVLEPGRHYLPVARDLHDLEDALAGTRDLDSMQRLADTAYEEIVASGRYSYDVFADRILSWIEGAPARRPAPLEQPTRRAAAVVDDRARSAARSAAAAPRAIRKGLTRGKQVVRAGGAGARLVVRTPEARHLLVDAYRNRALGRPHRLARELLHLNTIRKAQLASDGGFATGMRLSGDLLTLVSGRGAESINGHSGILAAVRAGGIRAISWQPPDREGAVELHQLALLARTCPDATAELLERFVLVPKD